MNYANIDIKMMIKEKGYSQGNRCQKIRCLDDWRKQDDYCSFAERRE